MNVWSNRAVAEAGRELEYWNRARSAFVPARHRPHRLRKVLVANRGEIAKRFFFALREEGIASVAVAVEGDRAQSWLAHADEVLSLGEDPGGYANIPLILAAVLKSNANALYPGYGFLSENPAFVDALQQTSEQAGREIIFMGPDAGIMRRVGNKLDARRLAELEGLPLFEGSDAFRFEGEPDDQPRVLRGICAAAADIGYPVILKLNAGGGGKGMVVAQNEGELLAAIPGVQRIGRSMYGDDTFYLERYITEPVHVEVQVFNGRAVGLRKCAVQRRQQKIIEENGDVFLDDTQTNLLCDAAERFAAASGYAGGAGAGTVEFLYDAGRREFGFLEMNTRLQVEYTVTDASLGIDLARWQILNFDGRREEIPYGRMQSPRTERPHALQCRVYAEDAFANYAPSPGRISHLELPTFNGIRCDFGFKAGDTVLPDYDPMIGKLIAWGETREEALVRMERALGEMTIHGITSNVDQLLAIVRHPEFRSGRYTNRLLETEAALSNDPGPRDFLHEAALCGSMIYREHLLRRSVAATLPDAPADTADFDRARRSVVPSVFEAEIHRRTLRVEFLALSLDQFLCLADGRYLGRLSILAKPVHSGGRWEVRFNGRRYVGEADLRKGFAILKMGGGPRGVEYFRLKLRAVLEDEEGASEGRPVRAPFQSAFVRLEDETLRPGAGVRAGQPILTIAAMKMETVITSPADGLLVELIEDGDPARLILGRTPAGLVRGRSIGEGEVLFRVVPATSAASSPDAGRSAEVAAGRDALSNLRSSAMKEALQRSPGPALRDILYGVRACLLGFVEDERVFENLAAALDDVPEKAGTGDKPKELAVQLMEVLQLYQLLRQTSAPSMLADTRAWITRTLNADGPGGRRTARNHPCEQLLRIYAPREDDAPAAVFGMLHGFRAAHRCARIVRALLDCAPRLPVLPRLRAVLLRLVDAAELHDDVDVEESVRRCLAHLFPGLHQQLRGFFDDSGRSFFAAYRRFHRDPLFLLLGPHDHRDEFEAACVAALQDESVYERVPERLPAWARETLTEKIAFLEAGARVRRLHSGTVDCLLYLLEEDDGAREFVCFPLSHEGAIALERDAGGRIIGAPGLENAAARAAALLTVYRRLEPAAALRVEILACGRPADLDLSGRDPCRINAATFLASARTILPFLVHLDYRLFSIDVLARLDGERLQRLQLSWYLHRGLLRMGLLLPEDPRHPYAVPAPERDLRLLQRNKWTAEQWARLAFDGGRYEEILIPSVDGARPEDKPAGAKIYRGTISSRPAVFYFKDSRVSGGATGDREGRKYAAAAYLAYRWNAPLYVWNDGAGANIKQGMISLNRAAQGFMMNALLSPAVEPRLFADYVRNQADPVLRDLFRELDGFPGMPGTQRTPDNVFVVAVGVGSSTGLDVYGSSQAAVQILLDHENSYRVLTGSAVIRAVTGEDLTNYEIGGAAMMGRRTGTVDLIVPDRLQVLSAVRFVHETFSRSTERPALPRLTPAAGPVGLNSEFLELKGDFAAAASLLGGAAHLGGRPVVILQPRTSAGIRGQAAWRKAAELVRLAVKTKAHLVVLCERGWRAGPPASAAELQARRDFSDNVRSLEGLRFLVGADPAVFAGEELASAVDVAIFVDPHPDAPGESAPAAGPLNFDDVREFTTLRAASFEEAFALIERLTGYHSGREHSVNVPVGTPLIPENTNSPFDMFAGVLRYVVDNESWLEVYAGRSSGLLTGFARLNGRPVAVIADQPAGGRAPDAPGTEKFRVFMQLAERLSLPVLMLSNAPGFVPGVKQERLRIQQIGGESLDVNVRSSMPVVSVVLNHNFGGRQIQAFSKFLRPGITSAALRRATLAVMGPSAAFDLFHGAEFERLTAAGDDAAAEQLRTEYLAAFREKSRADADAASTGLIDILVDEPAALRDELIRGLKIAIDRHRPEEWGK